MDCSTPGLPAHHQLLELMICCSDVLPPQYPTFLPLGDLGLPIGKTTSTLPRERTDV